MRARTVAEKSANAAIVLAIGALCLGGCGEPDAARFGPALVPPLSLYVGEPDLEAQLRAVESETGALGLKLAKELRGELPRAAGPVVVRSYAGRDALGRETRAVRVATSRGVVMAVGPLAASDARDRATMLVPALIPGPSGDEGAYQSGTDLNGDGSPDVVVRNERGWMEIWGIHSTGAARYPIEMALELPAARGDDIDADGRVDFVGEVEVPEGDPIAPRLEDAAAFQGAIYSNRTPGVRAWHARRADALAAAAAPSAATAPSPAPVSDAVRARRSLELAWHRILSGGPRKTALETLDKEVMPPDLREPFRRFRAIIGRIGGSDASARTP